MTQKLGQTVFLSSLVFYGLIEHKSFSYDLGTNSDSTLGFSKLVREQAKVVDWEALVVRVGDDILEADHDVRMSKTNAQGGHFCHGSWCGISFPFQQCLQDFHNQTNESSIG